MNESDDRGQMTEVRPEKLEDRGQKSDIRSKISDCFLSSICPSLLSVFCSLSSPVYSLTSVFCHLGV